MTAHRELVPLRDSAKELGYHIGHVYRLIKDGSLPRPIRLHEKGRQYFTRSQLDELIASRVEASR